MLKTRTLVLALAVAATSVAQAAPAGAVANGKLGFAGVDPDDGGATPNFEVFSIDPSDGSDRDDLTQAKEAVDVDPAWHPTGPDVAFARRGKNARSYSLWTVPGTGGNRVEIPNTGANGNSDRQPAWSPTGSQVAFARSVRSEDSTNVWVMNADGSGQTQLTDTAPPAYDASPAWSMDGSQIAFVSDRDGGLPEIYTMDAGGVTEVRRTNNTCVDANPSWSPTVSTLLAFERYCPGASASFDIFTLDTGTSIEEQLTSTPENEHQPAWAPDGTRIAYTRYPVGGGDKDVWAMDDDGANQNEVGGMTVRAELAPTWGQTAEELGAGTAADADGAEELEGTAPVSTSSPESLKPKAKKGQKKKKEKKKEKLTKGVTLKRMRKAGSDVYVLKVNPALKPRIDVALSNDKLSGHERTSKMAKRHKAVSAVNGDFGDPQTGRPLHTFAEDGDLKEISFAADPSFAISADEKATFFDRPFERVTVHEPDSGDEWLVERWNFGEPGYNEIAGFTTAGGSIEKPPANACSARLLPVSGRRWAPGNAGVEQDFQVNERGCSSSAMLLNGGVVLSAQPGSDGSVLLNSLTPGETVTLSWSVGFTGVLDTVGGMPDLVEDGVVTAKKCGEAICGKNPRTGIGVTGAGKVLLVVIDGRSEDSKGVTLKKFGSIMKGLHAVQAINLDGGGSSTMWSKKNGVENVPSDGKERKVSSAILVLKGKDTGEAIGAPLAKLPEYPSSGAPPPVIGDPGGDAALHDPGSTGGFLEALAEGTFGRPVRLPPDLRRALDEFRAGA